ncbi:hypothetical protein [uncultured Neglectibacter sp.]
MPDRETRLKAPLSFGLGLERGTGRVSESICDIVREEMLWPV